MANLLLASEPPPLAATVTSTVEPCTSSTVTHGGSVVFGVLARAGGIGLDARRAACCRDRDRRGARLRRPSPAGLAASSPGAASKRTSMPTLTKALTMPVSWQMGRWPSAHMRLLMRICAIASLAACDCSFS